MQAKIQEQQSMSERPPVTTVDEMPIMEDREWADFQYFCRWPAVTTYRRSSVWIVQYSTYGFAPGLTEEAQHQLTAFVRAYHLAHGIWRTPGPWFPHFGDRGLIPVRPEHAEEFATRVFVFITDPANCEDPDPDRQWREEARREIEAKKPDVVDDPLGTVPGE